jgi:hypothetical protein
MIMLKKLSMEVLCARIITKYEIDSISGCWNWTDAIGSSGYGVFWNGEKSVNAHRQAYELFVGDIPDGLCVCHTCDNRECINPAHFFLGTNAENTRDRVSKGRSARGLSHGTVTHPEKIAHNFGMKNGAVKLTEEQVNQIRAANMKHRELAQIFNVHQSSITRIKNFDRRPQG